MSQQLPDPASGAHKPNPPHNNLYSPSEAEDGLLGRVVGSYRLNERLGGGAMASVYRATDLRNGQQRALKLLLPGADSGMRERFRREVDTARQLDFPNIVRTLEVSPLGSNDLAYIAMELVEGESLGQLLERSGQLSMVDSCALLAPVARALAYAHERGVVHRDVKPSNILLRRSTWSDPNAVRIAAIDTPVVPLLSDFGIALVLDAPELTSAGRTIGTPAYMAPEQCADSREIDGRADMYALGAVLYRCLIGRPLYMGSTTQILHAHVYDPVVIPEENMRLLPPLVVEILQLALAKDPTDRYEDAAWLAEDLAVAAGQRARSNTRKSASSEVTATMASLPATSTNVRTTSHILIPAPTPKNERLPGERIAPSNATVDELPEEEPIIPLILPRKARVPLNRIARRTSGELWQNSGKLAALVLTGVIAVLAIIFAFVMWPQQPLPAAPVESTATVASATATSAQAVALVSPTDSPTATMTDTPVPSPTANDTESPTETPLPTVTETSVAITATNTVTVVPGSTEITPTGVPLTTSIVLEPGSALSAAQSALSEGEWYTALEYLGELRKYNPNYSPDSVAQLLGESYLMMAAANNQKRAYTATIDLLKTGRELLEGYPIVDQLKSLLGATEAIMRTESDAARSRALANLEQVHLSLASQMIDAGLPCQAVAHVAAAKAANDSVTVRTVETDYANRCAEFSKQWKAETFLASLGGELLYSAQTGSALEKSNIYRLPITTSATSTLLIANARFPVRQRSGPLVSYYSLSDIGSGLYGFDINKNLDASERGRPIAQQFSEDGRDSPASWSFAGDRLVFASLREGDRRPRLFFGYSTNTPTTKLLDSFATWPAWRPLRAESGEDWIVYNGTNSEGNEPGLWLVSSSGERLGRVTDNGDDIAPTWTPDGTTIFFMNKMRSGNWDIYSAPVSDTPQSVTPVRFASSDANDVMPTVSPDGLAVAFLSDRGGRWQIWIGPIDGSEPILFADIEGNIPDPTKQSMQWLK